MPRLAGLLEPLEIPRPFPIVLGGELVEHGPGVETRVVAIVEHDPHGVVAHGLETRDVHAFFAGDEHPLAGRVTLDLGRRRMHA